MVGPGAQANLLPSKIKLGIILRRKKYYFRNNNIRKKEPLAAYSQQKSKESVFCLNTKEC